MTEARFNSWSAPQSPVSVEYSLVVIEEIRHEALDGFQRLSRGGVEVGGVLYGTREGRTIRILAMRPIACEHAHGPSFQLSGPDKELLQEQLDRDPEDPRLSDMICVGWFVSHTRNGIVLSDFDQEIYSKYFAAPWQVTLVIRPGRGGAMLAGFFVREHDGTVRSESSYLEFNFPDRLAGVLDRAPRGESRGGETRAAEAGEGPRGRPTALRPRPVYLRELREAPVREAGLKESAPASQEQSQDPSALPAPQFLLPRAAGPKWPWLVLWAVIVLIGAGVGVRYWYIAQHPEPLGLAVAERSGQILIEWNHSAPPVVSAARGSLVITDGQAPRIFPLSRQALAQGAFTYKRVSDDVEVRLSVETSGGSKTGETTTFLGPPPNSADDPGMKQLQQERDDLQAEVDRLTKQNADQAKRIQQLQRNLKVLETRLGIQ